MLKAERKAAAKEVVYADDGLREQCEIDERMSSATRKMPKSVHVKLGLLNLHSCVAGQQLSLNCRAAMSRSGELQMLIQSTQGSNRLCSCLTAFGLREGAALLHQLVLYSRTEALQSLRSLCFWRDP